MDPRFIRLCQENGYSKKDLIIFQKALNFAEKNLSGRRLSGEKLTNHNFSMGKILIKSKLFPEVVTAGFLYGVEIYVSPSEIKENFGQEITDLVFGQLQLKEIKSKNATAESDVLRKILLVTLKDIRIIFVKLADKLSNLYNIDIFPKTQQRMIANEVLDIYAPLAYRFGLEYIRKQLEDKAFYIINEKKYKEISKFLKESKKEREEFIKNFIQEITRLFHKKVKTEKIKGREKQIYSIYKKMIGRKIPLDKQRDHFATRIIVDSEKDCYTVLGILHENYESISGHLKDYIANPKPNGYQSIHTILKVENKKIEIQIRTKNMDDIAEEGKAAHWSYKKLKSDVNFEKKTAWLRSILDLQSSGKENLQGIKLNLFADSFFCYTPLGKAVDLPVGSTVLDFAYHIHQEVGNTAIGGRINGEFASLKKELHSGDVIEIITNKHQRPRRNWIKFVKSTRAKSFIRKEVKKRENIPVVSQYSLKKEEKEKCEGLACSIDFPNHNFDLAKCCCPVPDDEIVGIIKSHKRILVHKKNCDRIHKVKDKVIEVFWKEIFNKPIQINVETLDRSGILADLLHTITSGSFVVKEANAKLLHNNISECNFIVVPQELNEVIRLVKRIKKVRGVKKIYFG